MNETIYDTLEFCIEALERGETIEACLARYPRQADELRPLLQTLAQTYEAAVRDVPVTAKQHARTRVLNYAAELRERGLGKTPFTSSIRMAFNKSFVIFVLLIVLIISGTGLVYASGGALPGDNLYSVKRTWEEVRLQFAFSSQHHQTLEAEFEQERVDEVQTLITYGRVERINLIGHLTGIFPDHLIVSEITVFIDSQTQLPPMLTLNQWVRVIGETRADGTAFAKQVILVRAINGEDKTKPVFETPVDKNPGNDGSPEIKTSEPSMMPEPSETPLPTETLKHGPKPGKGPSTPTPVATESAGDFSGFEFEGIVQQMNEDTWTVDDHTILITEQAVIEGEIVVGAAVIIEGYVEVSGNLIATHIELIESATPAPGSDDHPGGGGGRPTPPDDHDG